ncbi:hypothetical protein OS493_005165 [Desmophyllum pertusum]|uniref:Uncharacterized protein n=1 Tax=Desmophyllum pertusum TaxID=174260 RepID=A0A9W9Z6P1_9CNID|nr:hypothetical protein OS493_005165 [Desmophyllum pertusum]
MVSTRLISSMFCVLLVSSCLVYTEAFNSNNGQVGKRSSVKVERTIQAVCQLALEHCGDIAPQQKSRDAEMANMKWDKRNI